jgi:hypothetical protein
MKLLDSLPLIVILVLLSVLGYFGYTVYQDYQENKDKSAPGTTPGSAPAANFGSYVDDSLFSIGQSPIDLAAAQQQTFVHPYCTLKSILGLDVSGCSN